MLAFLCITCYFFLFLRFLLYIFFLPFLIMIWGWSEYLFSCLRVILHLLTLLFLLTYHVSYNSAIHGHCVCVCVLLLFLFTTLLAYYWLLTVYYQFGSVSMNWAINFIYTNNPRISLTIVISINLSRLCHHHIIDFKTQSRDHRKHFMNMYSMAWGFPSIEQMHAFGYVGICLSTFALCHVDKLIW